MHSTITHPTAGTFVGFIVGPTDAHITDIPTDMGLTADIAAIISLIPMADIILTLMEGIVRTCMDLIVELIGEHIGGVITNSTRPDPGERWPSRLVATAAEDRLNISPAN